MNSYSQNNSYSEVIFDTAVLFLIFNRPETTAQVFNTIRKAKPARLYISSDGPRSGQKEEFLRVNQARQIATDIDWPCEVKTFFRDEHLGCSLAVRSGINWFFETEEQGIILEDDCIPSQSFFQFSQAMLEKHKNTESIMSISGLNIQATGNKGGYFYSKYALIWGWATWRRAWEKCDHELLGWTLNKKNYFRLCNLNFNFPERSYWKRVLNLTAEKKIDSWAYPWIHTSFINGARTVVPRSNLIRNIGFSKDATHTKGWHPILSCLIEHEVDPFLNCLSSMDVDEEYDKFVSNCWFEGSWGGYFKSSLCRARLIIFLNQIRLRLLKILNHNKC